MPLAAAAGRSASSAASTIGASSIGRSSSRSLPVTIRDTSRMSAISCSCRCALRSMVSSARVIAGGIELAHPQQPRPAEHRVQRRPQLVRQRREEVFLRAVGGRQILGAPPQVLLEPLALGDVAHHQRETLAARRPVRAAPR